MLDTALRAFGPTGPTPAVMWGQDSSGLSQPDSGAGLLLSVGPCTTPSEPRQAQGWEEGKSDRLYTTDVKWDQNYMMDD